MVNRNLHIIISQGTMAMRLLNLVVLSLTSIALSSCSSINSVQPVNHSTQTKPAVQHSKKNPMAVSFYPSTKNLSIPYVVLGKETVSKFNFVGIKRQEATIHDTMRNLAASMGGDAVIDIQHGDKMITGTVIAYRSRYEV